MPQPTVQAVGTPQRRDPLFLLKAHTVHVTKCTRVKATGLYYDGTSRSIISATNYQLHIVEVATRGSATTTANQPTKSRYIDVWRFWTLVRTPRHLCS